MKTISDLCKKGLLFVLLFTMLFSTLELYPQTVVFAESNTVYSADELLPPTAAPGAGTYETTQQITLQSEVVEAGIYYTLDGSDPQENGIRYESPISVDASVSIIAYIKSGDLVSDTILLQYTIDREKDADTESPERNEEQAEEVAEEEAIEQDLLKLEEAEELLRMAALLDENPAYAEHFLTKPGKGFAYIRPNYPGMSITEGRPAVIDASKQTDKFPVFHISNARTGLQLVAQLYGPDQTIVYTSTPKEFEGQDTLTIPDTVQMQRGTYRLLLTLTADGKTLYDTYYFTAIDEFATYHSIHNEQNSNNANVGNVNYDEAGIKEYPAVQLLQDRLAYIPDYKGNQITDFSNVGYKGGGVDIPNVPVKVRLEPLVDDTMDAWDMIQNAINYVSGLVPDNSGFRGAVYLNEGIYRISRPLTIRASGVVIQGAGQGTPTDVKGDGSQANPLTYELADQAFETGVTKLISTWKVNSNSTWVPEKNDDRTPNTNTESGVNVNSPRSTGQNSTLIHFSGSSPTTGNDYVEVTDQYVGAGQFSVHVADVSKFEVGEVVEVRKRIDINWAKAMYMDRIDGAADRLWSNSNTINTFNNNFKSERTIAAIDRENKQLTFAEPLADNLDMRWDVARIYKLTNDGRLTNVGVEGIQGISHFYAVEDAQGEAYKPLTSRYNIFFRTYNDENHAMVFVTMNAVKDGWVRNFQTYHLDIGFQGGGQSRNITVQDGAVLDPVSYMDAGERRYSIYFNTSQFMLGQRLYTRFMRHAYAFDAYTSGPNVFYNSNSDYTADSSEPHFRWSSAGLYDNMRTRVHIQNRWNWGTSHGHSGVNYVLYNSEGPFIMSQPQISPNYLIGHSYDYPKDRLKYGETVNVFLTKGDELTGHLPPDFDSEPNLFLLQNANLNNGQVPNFPAYMYSVERKVSPALDNMPDSLYLQQVKDRLGTKAVESINQLPIPPALLSELSINGQVIEGFKSRTFIYTYDLGLDFVELPEIAVASSDGNAKIDIIYPEHYAQNEIQIVLTNANQVKTVYTIRLSSGVITSPIVSASSEQINGSNTNYALHVLNPDLTEGNPDVPRWAAENEAALTMYLGNQAKRIEGIELGVVRPGSGSRAYQFGVEFSLDGKTWIKPDEGTYKTNTQQDKEGWSYTTEGRIAGIAVNSNNTEHILQTFYFSEPTEARFIRFTGAGNTVNQWNNYWRLRPVFADGSVYTPPTAVSIKGDESITVGDKAQLQAVITPDDATVKDVFWSSSNPSIVKVDQLGHVTAIAAGTAIIKAVTADGQYQSDDGIPSIQYNTSTLSVTVVEKIINYRVSFHTGDESNIAEQTVEAGSTLAAPEAPARDEYRFAGWFKDQQHTIPWIFDTDKVDSDLVLYAKWIHEPSYVYQPSTPIAVERTALENQREITEQLENKQAPSLTIPATSKKAELNAETARSIGLAGQGITIKKDAFSVFIPAHVLSLINPDSTSVTIVISPLSTDDALQAMKQVDAKLLSRIYELSIIVNGVNVEQFNEPIELRLNIAGANLQSDNATSIIKLTGTGLKHNRGGVYSDKDGVITGYTHDIGLYAAASVKDLVALHLSLKSLEYELNDQPYTFDVSPLLVENRTLVPIRLIAESFGAKVSWDPATFSAVIALEGKELRFTIGQATENMEVPAMLFKQRTMIPLRFVAEYFGANVLYDKETKGITIFR